jgi:enoyl-CoA hydratase/carnithine racemase
MTENFIVLEREGNVAVLRLSRGVTNAIDLQMVSELAQAVETVKLDPALLGLVLTSNNDKFLSIGFDIPGLIQLSEDEFTRFYHAFNRACLDLFLLPKPTVAAITGHAIAGGCILALCCDYRFVAEGRKLMGLNEIKLGVPVPYVADRILGALVGYRNARQVVDTGNFYPSGESLQLGLVDKVLAQEKVLAEAMAKVRQLGGMPGRAYSLIKGDRVEPVAAEIRRGLEERERRFVECWFSDEARQALRQAASKF